MSRHLNERGIESFLPLYRTVHNWSHSRQAALDLPLFPNYLFVHIAPESRIRALEVPGIVTLIGRGSAPTPLPDMEIERLRYISQARALEPAPYLEVGKKARIIAGPLAGVEGRVLRSKNGGLRFVLTVDLIRQSVAVEVALEELGPAGPSLEMDA